MRNWIAAIGTAVIYLVLPEVGLTRVEVLLTIGMLFWLFWFGIDAVMELRGDLRRRKFHTIISQTDLRRGRDEGD